MNTELTTTPTQKQIDEWTHKAKHLTIDRRGGDYIAAAICITVEWELPPQYATYSYGSCTLASVEVLSDKDADAVETFLTTVYCSDEFVADRVALYRKAWVDEQYEKLELLESLDKCFAMMDNPRDGDIVIKPHYDCYKAYEYGNTVEIDTDYRRSVLINRLRKNYAGRIVTDDGEWIRKNRTDEKRVRVSLKDKLAAAEARIAELEAGTR